MRRSFHDRRALNAWGLSIVPLFFAAILVVLLVREGPVEAGAFGESASLLAALALASVVLGFIGLRRACVEVRVSREGVEVIHQYPFARKIARYPPLAIARPHIDEVTTSGKNPTTFWRAVFRTPAGDELILARSMDMEDAQALIRAFDSALGGRDQYGG
jgi:hypothetical protein